MEPRPKPWKLPPFVARLAAWAQGEFRKLKPLPEGGTLGDAFAAYKRDTGRRHPEDHDHLTPPIALLYLYGWFWEVAQGRPASVEGVAMPIPSAEMLAWAQLAGLRPQDWELAALRALDAAYLRVAAEKGV